MSKIVVSDTSCFILLDKIGHLQLLRDCFEVVLVTPEIAAEFGQKLPNWVVVQKAINQSMQGLLEEILGSGESSAIALAAEIQSATVILDDDKARKIGANFKLKIIGTLGLFVLAKKRRLIPAVRPLLELVNKTNFRVSHRLIHIVLQAANEE